VSWITNMQAGNKLAVSLQEHQLLCNFCSVHIPAQIRCAFPWISLSFVVFFNILLNKTPWDQTRINKQSSVVQVRINPFYIVSYGKNSFCLQAFCVTNGLQERIKFKNRGSTVQVFSSARTLYWLTACTFKMHILWITNQHSVILKFPTAYRPWNLNLWMITKKLRIWQQMVAMGGWVTILSYV
jgi:hypothetical protein